MGPTEEKPKHELRKVQPSSAILQGRRRVGQGDQQEIRLLLQDQRQTSSRIQRRRTSSDAFAAGGKVEGRVAEFETMKRENLL